MRTTILTAIPPLWCSRLCGHARRTTPLLLAHTNPAPTAAEIDKVVQVSDTTLHIILPESGPAVDVLAETLRWSGAERRLTTTALPDLIEVLYKCSEP